MAKEIKKEKEERKNLLTHFCIAFLTKLTDK
jgi:hypothetical protein